MHLPIPFWKVSCHFLLALFWTLAGVLQVQKAWSLAEDLQGSWWVAVWQVLSLWGR